ncbi:hypothetical protein HYT01_01755 [Candidatus Giovannonibacteria bacterium]|nr:hypothetical protein [Candidatus Giovannonibacteria bacterium]
MPDFIDNDEPKEDTEPGGLDEDVDSNEDPEEDLEDLSSWELEEDLEE